MATQHLQSLAAVIYHEEQPPDSMLCAQHALNNLLQGSYFTPVDLAAIATKLDELEDSFRDDVAEQSRNMDDSGFFSVQVVQDALKVWGLNLSPWRSEEMHPYQDEPQKMLAFILNYQQHWYTLRRFGEVQTHPDLDEGHGHWFNLNSQLPAPTWIGKTHLGMVIAQAEADGYSVFAITQADPDAPLALSRVDADRAAAGLTDTGHPNGELQDEDMDLQRALQASLAQGPEHEDLDYVPPPVTARDNDDEELDDDEPQEPIDPVEASRLRSERFLAQTLRHQQYAQHEIMQEVRQRPPQPSAEDEEMRRAIEASMESARAEGHSVEENNEENDDENMPLDSVQQYPATTHTETVYDDDDAELQAAIAASMGQLPDDWVMPIIEPPPMSPASTIPLPPQFVPELRPQVDEDEWEEGDSSMAEEPAVEAPPQEVDLEEMRRRRLARYGS